MKYFVEDTFMCQLSPNHRLYESDKKHPVITFRVPNEKVDTFPLKKGDSLVTDGGESFNVLDFEWFTTSFARTVDRGIGILLDRPMERGEYVRIFSEVNMEELYNSDGK